MNSRTNLAYDHCMEAPYSVGLPKEQSNVRIRVSAKTKEQAVTKKAHALGLGKILIVALFAFLVLCRGVMITDKSAAVAEKKAELNALITSNEKLQVEIDRALDLKNIEAIAVNELGMRRAEKYQTVYVELAQADFVEKTVRKDYLSSGRTADAVTGIVAYMD